MSTRKRSRGFTLIELLIVVAIIGIIVAIAIPNLLNAIQRAKQRRTMGDMRSIGTAVEAYNVDFNSYPPAAAGEQPVDYVLDSGSTIGASWPRYLSPTYIKVVPLADGWNSWFMVNTGGSRTHYAIKSEGKNGTDDGTLTGPSTNFNADIWFVDGKFVAWPEGVQR